MTTPSDPTQGPVAKIGIRVLRTVVPALWGTAIAFLIARGMLPESARTAAMSVADVLLMPLTSGVWYSVATSIEHLLPAWLTRLVLGSNQAPVYPAA